MDALEELDAFTDEHIRYWKILLLEPITPLLRKEIYHAIALHSEATHPNVDQARKDQNLKELNALAYQIKRHWYKMYVHPCMRAELLENMVKYQHFLTGKLLEDYAEEPYTMPKWVPARAASIIEAKSGGDDGQYLIRVKFPLEELMLNHDHVESKLLSAVAEQNDSRSHIQHLIGRNDWSGLATVLTNDRDLATRLFQQRQYFPDLFITNPSKRVLRGIDKIEKKYSSHIQHTKGMSARQVSGDTDDGASLMPLLSNASHHEKSSSGSFVSSIYNAITSGIRLPNSSLRSRKFAKQD